MALALHTYRMFFIASVFSQTQIRRSLVGALATDPVVPAHPPRARRRTRAQVAHVTGPLAPARSSA
jgi:hypothetical protein